MKKKQIMLEHSPRSEFKKKKGGPQKRRLNIIENDMSAITFKMWKKGEKKEEKVLIKQKIY